MNKTRFTPWVVLVCMSAIAACTSGEGGTVGNTELNVIVPNNESSPGVPAPIDIQQVQYTINCVGGLQPPGGFLDGVPPDNSFPDAVVLNGNLEVVDGRTNIDTNPNQFGTFRPGDGAEIWQAFMDLPPGPCTIQLRALDSDEVICTATESFFINADTTAKVNLVLICDVSFQAPVGMLDVDATFSFVVGNFCPDLFALNCIDSDPVEVLNETLGIGLASSICEVRYRDGDSTCGQGCDPQLCNVVPEGLDCGPGPDPGVTTTITCVGGQIDCDGDPLTTETECVFGPGDELGTLGAPADTGSWFAGCIPPALGGAPGAIVTCTAVTTDGDLDCNKTKEVSIECPGIDPCNDPANPDPCDDSDACTIDLCDSSTGAAVCDNSGINDGGACTDGGGFPGVCDAAGVCVSTLCSAQPDPDGFCDDTNECTTNTCNLGTGACETAPDTGDSCATGTGVCDAGGVCVDNCASTVCNDGNQCTDDACDPAGNAGAACPDNGPCCSATPDDTNACDTCPGIGGVSCECTAAGVCIDGLLCPPNAAAPGGLGNPIIGQAQTSCRNSFNQLLSQFPVDYEIELDNCAFANQTVNADVTPTLNFEASFLQVAADTLCAFGIDICANGASFTDVQVQVASTATTPGSDPTVDPAVGTDQGASSTPQLTELPGVPATLPLTCSSNCPAPVVLAPVAIPLPPVTLALAVGAGTDATGPDASLVSICATGSTPNNSVGAPTGTQDVNTWAEVSIGFPNPVSFQCGDATVSVADPCTVAGDCLPATSGELPFNAAACDPATSLCVTQTRLLDPQVDCATFPVQ